MAEDPRITSASRIDADAGDAALADVSGLASPCVIEARALINEAMRLAASLPDTDNPDFYWMRIVKTQAQAGWIADARRSLGELSGTHLRAEAHGEIGCAEARAGDLDAARITLSKIPTGDRFVRDRILNALAEALVTRGDLDEAVAVAASIVSQARRSIVRRKIAGARARYGDFEAAMTGAEQIEGGSVHVNALLDVANAMRRHRRGGEASLALEAAERASERIGSRPIEPSGFAEDLSRAGFPPDGDQRAIHMARAQEAYASVAPRFRAQALRLVAVGWADLGDYDSAKRVASGVSVWVEQAKALYGIARREYRRGNPVQALRTLDMATAATDAAVDGHDQAAARDVIESTRLRIEGAPVGNAGSATAFMDMDVALQRASISTEAGGRSVVPWRSRYVVFATEEEMDREAEIARVETAVSSYLRDGDFDGALATAQEIEPEDRRSAAIEAIVRTRAWAGDIDGGLTALARISVPRDRIRPLLTICKAKLNAEAATNGRPAYCWCEY